eukprot:TRINITY_DN1562_c2_g1_i1.p1 TRINITY_DN1562_c2_g1~~TRINITY_DN1562_c2_g1_i1.p1  ORF type:complete len:427 (+),score=64.69 TRINITY_DN1562_c2_g1_i1:51-1283(+)
MSEDEYDFDFNTFEGLQHILVEEWTNDLSFGGGIDLAMTSGHAFTGKLITYVIKKALLRSTTYALLATERVGIMRLVRNTLSMGWLESWYFKKLWTTRIVSTVSSKLLPSWLSLLIDVNESPFAETYLLDIEDKSPGSVAMDTFQRHLLPTLTNIVYEYIVLPILCSDKRLFQQNSIMDSIGSLLIRPIGSYIGHILLPHKGYGSFWGGLTTYLLYCLYIQRLFIKHIEDTWDNNDTEEVSNTFHGGDVENSFYKTLSVDEDADEKTIRSAYRKLAREYHPDKHAQAEPEVQKRNENKMKDVTSAYTNLVDPRKRRIYDAWLEEQVQQAANQAAAQSEPSSPTDGDSTELVVTDDTVSGGSSKLPSVDLSLITKPLSAAALVFQLSLGLHLNCWSAVKAGSQGGVLLATG